MARVMPLVVAALLGALVSGASAWVTLGRQMVTRDEVLQIVEAHSPYLEDRKGVARAIAQLDQLEVRLDAVQADLAAHKALLETILYRINSVAAGPR